MNVTGAQAKAARQLLGWSPTKLEGKTGVRALVITNFEDGRGQPSLLHLTVLRKIFEAAGIEFDDDGADVRLRTGK
jgi:transcriptional regulator with XRE-family HTH domain